MMMMADQARHHHDLLAAARGRVRTMKRLRLVPSLLVYALIVEDEATLLVGSFAPSLALLPRQAGRADGKKAGSRTIASYTPSSFEPSDGSSVTKNEKYGADESEWREVYQRVAEHDPTWFDAYVVHVLDTSRSDDETPAPVLLGASSVVDPEINSHGQQNSQSSSGPSVDDLMAELARLDEDFRNARIGHHQAAADAATATPAETTTPTATTEQDALDYPPSKPQELELATAATVDKSEAASLEGDNSVDPRGDIHQVSQANADEAIEPEADVESRVLEPTVLAGSSRERMPEIQASSVEGPEVSRDDVPAVGAAAVARSETPKAVSPVTAATASADDRVVVYRDSSLQDSEYSTIPFASLEELGYREADVASLRPEALELIVTERLRRPRSGVPDRWKRDAGAIPRAAGRRDADDLVSIVAESDVKAFVERTSSKEPPRTKFDASTKSDLDPATSGRRSRVSDEKYASREESMSGRRDNIDAPPRDKRVDEPTDRKAPEPRSRGEGRSRPIYSGRPVRRERTAVSLQDPPKQSAFWPDIDTFRNLLRDEASLRLRILGNDWAGVVKDESDWRLDLYTRWLWTLHHGVGEPIVESRSDRMRRMSYRSSAAVPPAPRVRKPSSSKSRGSSGGKRKRPNPETI
jgi:hypothetical protein